MTQPYINNIPEELKALPQWVLWHIEERGGKLTKVPYTVYGERASTTNPQTWSAFESAYERLKNFQLSSHLFISWTPENSGIGFVFTADDPYCGIDLDHCLDEQERVCTAMAREVLDRFCEYGVHVEVSPSGAGLHLITRARLPDDKGIKQSGIEIYNTGRYFTVTGDLRGECDGPAIDDGQIAVNEILKTLQRSNPPVQTSSPPNDKSDPSSEPPRSWRDIHITVDPAAQPRLEKLFKLQQQKQFKAIWDQDPDRRQKDHSDSAYDMALARLAYDAGWEAQEIADLLIYRRAEQGKGKTARLDYYQRTIFKLITTEIHRAAVQQLDHADSLDPESETDREAALEMIQTITGLRILKYVQYGKSPATYGLWLHTKEGDGEAHTDFVAIASARDARHQDTWQDIAQERLGKPFDALSAKKWSNFLHCLSLIRQYEHIEEGSQTRDVIDALAQYGRTRAASEPDAAAIEECLPFYDAYRILCFNRDHFISWLMLMRLPIPSKNLISVLRGIGAQGYNQKALRLDGTYASKRYWRITLPEPT